MKSSLTILLLILSINLVLAQKNDTIYKHSGKVLIGEVIRINEYTINYRLLNERLEQTLGKLAIFKIKYGSGRTEFFSTKIEIRDEDDFKLVKIIENSELVVGLSNSTEIKGMTGVSNLHSPAGANIKAVTKMKKEAARIKAPYILITSELDSRGTRSELGSNQGLKRGFAYTYDEPSFELSPRVTKQMLEGFFDIYQMEIINSKRRIILKQDKQGENYDNEFIKGLNEYHFNEGDLLEENDYLLIYYIGEYDRSGPNTQCFQVQVIDNNSGKTILKYSSKLKIGNRGINSILDEISYFLSKIQV